MYAVLHDPAVTKIADARSLNLTDGQLKLIEGLVPVLKPLYFATRTMCSELYPTVGGIYPILFSIINHHLAENDQDTAAVAKFKKDVHSDLVKRNHIESDEIISRLPVICTFLDPGYRSLPFLTEPQRKLVHESVLERVDTLQLPMSQPTADSPTIIFQPGPFLLGGYLQATTSATMSNCAKELERHLCDKAVP